MLRQIFLLFITVFITVCTFAQTDASTDITGKIYLADNTIVEGTIRDNIRKKGEVILIRDGKKLKYRAGNVSKLELGSTTYITSNYTFYKLLHVGNTTSILQKANEPAGVEYNGSDAVVVNSEGNVDDYFIKTAGAVPKLVNRKNVSDVIGTCAGELTSVTTETLITALKACGK